jgi:DNA-binding NarL/FixJ family response regulator
MLDPDLSPPFDSTGRLQDLLSLFSTLRSDNRALVSQLRGSIRELREHREELQQRRVYPTLVNRNGSPKQPRLGQEFGLTRRETEVARLLSQGRSNQAIARELDISEHTARHHTQRILNKLQVHSRGEAGAKIRG